MKKNTFLYILLALVVFFFVFGMGRSVYEGFNKSCTLRSECETSTHCGGCPHGYCIKGAKKITGVKCR